MSPLILTIGWCEYDKGGVLYQASVNAFPEILGIGVTPLAAAKDLNRRTKEMYRAIGQFETGAIH